MKNLIYNLCKIAENNKLLNEVIQSNVKLNKQQNDNFCNLFNKTQELMRITASDYLKIKNKSIDKIVNKKTYISEHIAAVENALLNLKRENNLKFSNEYIKFIRYEK